MTSARNMNPETKMVHKKRISCNKNKSLPVRRNASILRNRRLTAPLTASLTRSSPVIVNAEPLSKLENQIDNLSLCGSCSTEKPASKSLLAKQQRLLILYHSSHCKATDSCPCLVTKHCATMKTLWQHISTCHERECKVRHCYSSRIILSHFQKCNDDSCRICLPVKVALSNRKMKRVASLNATTSAAMEISSHSISNSATVTPVASPRRVSFVSGQECSIAEKNITRTTAAIVASTASVEREPDSEVKIANNNNLISANQPSSTRVTRRVSFSNMDQIHLFLG